MLERAVCLSVCLSVALVIHAYNGSRDQNIFHAIRYAMFLISWAVVVVSLKVYPERVSKAKIWSIIWNNLETVRVKV